MNKNITVTGTGIVRRMDDLGRVTIPKALRDSHGFKEGAPAEIFTTPDGIYLQLYTPDRETSAANRNKTAVHWLNNHQRDLARYYAKFSIDGDTTTCEVISPTGGGRMVARAKRNPADIYDPNIGMIYAFCRASGIMIPANLL